MKIESIAITPPNGLPEDQLEATNEILAASAAKYSRSKDGMRKILSTVDWDNPRKSVERIFKFVDYGHASIGGLTGSIAICLDDVTMWLATKLFELSPKCDGQESSSRYITLTKEGLPDWSELGMPDELAEKMQKCAENGLDAYSYEYERLNKFAEDNPDTIKFPDGANDKVKQRVIKNFGLDRARSFLPYAIKTNVLLIQTARDWVETVSGLLSMPQKECQDAAELILVELKKFAPELIRHAVKKTGWTEDNRAELIAAIIETKHSSHTEQVSDLPYTQVMSPRFGDLQEAIESRENRYDRSKAAARLSSVYVEWVDISIAELRDLNRHRTGGKEIIYCHRGFYLCDEIDRTKYVKNINEHSDLLDFVTKNEEYHKFLPYALRLGSQCIFSHCMQMDKFTYEAELRTGTGAHFRYAKHLRDAVEEVKKKLSEDYNPKLGDNAPE